MPRHAKHGARRSRIEARGQEFLALPRGVGRVQDEAGVKAVLVVPPPEERGGLVEPGDIGRRKARAVVHGGAEAARQANLGTL